MNVLHICVIVGASLAFVVQVGGMATGLKSQVVESCELMGIPETGMLKGIVSSEKRDTYLACSEKMKAIIEGTDYKIVYAVVLRFKEKTDPDDVKTIVSILKGSGWDTDLLVHLIERVFIGFANRVEILKKVIDFEAKTWWSAKLKVLVDRNPHLLGDLVHFVVLNPQHKESFELYVEWQSSVNGSCRNWASSILPYLTEKAKVEKDRNELQKILVGFCCYEGKEPSWERSCRLWSSETIDYVFSLEKIKTAPAANVAQFLGDGSEVVIGLKGLNDASLGWELSTVYDDLTKCSQETTTSLAKATKAAIDLRMRRATFDKLRSEAAKSKVPVDETSFLNFIGHLGKNAQFSMYGKKDNLKVLFGSKSHDSDIVRLVLEAYSYATIESATITVSQKPGVVTVLFKCVSRCAIYQIIDLLTFVRQNHIRSDDFTSLIKSTFPTTSPLLSNCPLNEIKKATLQMNYYKKVVQIKNNEEVKESL